MTIIKILCELCKKELKSKKDIFWIDDIRTCIYCYEKEEYKND